MASIELVRQLVDMQAEDGGLFFLSNSIVEAYIQQELRRLHEVVESDDDHARELIADYEPAT